MIKGPGSSSSVDETDTPLVLGKEKTGISSPNPKPGRQRPRRITGITRGRHRGLLQFTVLSAAAARAGSPSIRLCNIHGKPRREYQQRAASCSAKPAVRSFYSERAE